MTHECHVWHGVNRVITGDKECNKYDLHGWHGLNNVIEGDREDITPWLMDVMV